MDALTVALLGSPPVERDGVPVGFDTRKATALLAYLALPATRTAATGWAPSCGPTRTRPRPAAALRRTMSVLNAAAGGPLAADRSSVGLRPAGIAVDVADFRRLAADHALASSTVPLVEHEQGALF